MKLTELLLRWMPTFLAFPIGGLIAKLIFGSASSTSKAVGGGLIVGIVVGLSQFLALKKYGISISWVIASVIALVLAALLNSYLFTFNFDSASLASAGLIAGLILGFSQSLSQTKNFKFVLIWTICTAIAWSVAWFITSKVIVDPEAQYHVFGSSGALLATLVLGIVIKFILPLAFTIQNSLK